LLKAIRLKRKDIELKPILFLSYNISGLLIKQALINAYNNPKYTLIKVVITRLAFFAILYYNKDLILISLRGIITKIATIIGF